MTMEDKGMLGYRTKATEMQDRLDEIRKLLESEKADWAGVLKGAMAEQDRLHADLKNTLKLPKPSEHLVMMQTRDIGLWNQTELIARLGLAITETHERLATCEKAIEDLKLRIK